ncbi:hypothetical protein FQN53_009347 [Emmonsiellopsis sp. PD_33]|nr:hypothetical protein FQN53_009347 [Emmonsiellopsis sp. PD_33]
MAIPQAGENSGLALAMQQQLESSVAGGVALSQELDTAKALLQHAEAPFRNSSSLGANGLRPNGNEHVSSEHEFTDGIGFRTSNVVELELIHTIIAGGVTEAKQFLQGQRFSTRSHDGTSSANFGPPTSKSSESPYNIFDCITIPNGWTERNHEPDIRDRLTSKVPDLFEAHENVSLQNIGSGIITACQRSYGPAHQDCLGMSTLRLGLDDWRALYDINDEEE